MSNFDIGPDLLLGYVNKLDEIQMCGIVSRFQNASDQMQRQKI